MCGRREGAVGITFPGNGAVVLANKLVRNCDASGHIDGDLPQRVVGVRQRADGILWRPVAELFDTSRQVNVLAENGRSVDNESDTAGRKCRAGGTGGRDSEASSRPCGRESASTTVKRGQCRCVRPGQVLSAERRAILARELLGEIPICRGVLLVDGDEAVCVAADGGGEILVLRRR